MFSLAYIVRRLPTTYDLWLKKKKKTTIWHKVISSTASQTAEKWTSKQGGGLNIEDNGQMYTFCLSWISSDLKYQWNLPWCDFAKKLAPALFERDAKLVLTGTIFFSVWLRFWLSVILSGNALWTGDMKLHTFLLQEWWVGQYEAVEWSRYQ